METNGDQLLWEPLPLEGVEEDGFLFAWEPLPVLNIQEEEAYDDYVHVIFADLSVEDYLTTGWPTENVKTGLTPEEISARMKPYECVFGAQADVGQCCICLDDCHGSKELGKLDCGHEFHYACIRAWLLQKNSCPLCKRTALAGEG